MIACRKWLNLFACLFLAAVLTSCYESLGPLSKPGVSVDAALLGSWQCVPDPKEDPDKTFVIRIFRFDDYQYYAELMEEEEVTRYRAYPTVLDSSILLNVQEISQDSENEKWGFIRYQLTQSKTLNLAIVSDKAVTSKDESEALQEIRKRVAQDALYQTFASCIRQKS